MNWKTVVPLVVAIGLGTVAAVVGRGMMAKGRQARPAAAGVARVVVATADLQPGAVIGETDVSVRDVPAGGLPAEVVFADAGDVIGRVVTTHVVKGQAVLATLLAPKGSLGGLQAMVPPGMRAVTLEVNEFSGLGGLLIPGARVDVVQTIQPKGESAGLMARTIVQNLRVLAVGRRLSAAAAAGAGEAESGPAKSVTLMATAEQAEAIDLASHLGTPRLVLRNGADEGVAGGKGLTVSELQGGKREGAASALGALAGLFGKAPATRPAELVKVEPAVAARPSYREVEVIRGGASTSVKVELGPGGTDVVGGGDQLDRVVPGDR